MPKAVRYDQYGGVEVLKVVDVPQPEPGPGGTPQVGPLHGGPGGGAP